jgi:hypothetical protein
VRVRSGTGGTPKVSSARAVERVSRAATTSPKTPSVIAGMIGWPNAPTSGGSRSASATLFQTSRATPTRNSGWRAKRPASIRARAPSPEPVAVADVVVMRRPPG